MLIIALEVWNSVDKISEAKDGKTALILGKFEEYNKDELITKQKGTHDNAQLITGKIIQRPILMIFYGEQIQMYTFTQSLRQF